MGVPVDPALQAPRRQRVFDPGPDQLLPAEPDCRGVRRRVPEAKAEEPHERQPVAQPMLELLVRKVAERAEHDHLEHLYGFIGRSE